ncbi:MAG: lysylphosphatidylglycerol synthase transmembrane domain-containing protein [Candidatus Dormibacteria bacterium]
MTGRARPELSPAGMLMAAGPEDELAAPLLRQRLLSRRTLLTVGIAAAIVGVGIWRAPINWADAATRIRSASPGLYILALLSYYLSFLVRGVRWKLLLRNVGDERPTAALTSIIITSFFVNCVVPAKLGDVYRAVLVRQRQRIGATKALGTIIAERLLDLVVLMALLVIAGALTFHNRVPRVLVPYVAAGGLLALLGIAFVLVLSRGRGQRILVRLPERVVERYENFRVGTVHALGNLPAVTALTVMVWGLEATRLGFVVLALHFGGGRLGPPQFLLIALVAALLTTVPFLPGGLGLVETGMVLVLVTVGGLGRDRSISIALLDRSISYGSLVVVGFLVFAFSHLRSPHQPRSHGLPS